MVSEQIFHFKRPTASWFSISLRAQLKQKSFASITKVENWPYLSSFQNELYLALLRAHWGNLDRLLCSGIRTKLCTNKHGSFCFLRFLDLSQSEKWRLMFTKRERANRHFYNFAKFFLHFFMNKPRNVYHHDFYMYCTNVQWYKKLPPAVSNFHFFWQL